MVSTVKTAAALALLAVAMGLLSPALRLPADNPGADETKGEHDGRGDSSLALVLDFAIKIVALALAFALGIARRRGSQWRSERPDDPTSGAPGSSDGQNW